MTPVFFMVVIVSAGTYLSVIPAEKHKADLKPQSSHELSIHKHVNTLFTKNVYPTRLTF